MSYPVVFLECNVLDSTLHSKKCNVLLNMCTSVRLVHMFRVNEKTSNELLFYQFRHFDIPIMLESFTHFIVSYIHMKIVDKVNVCVSINIIKNKMLKHFYFFVTSEFVRSAKIGVLHQNLNIASNQTFLYSLPVRK